VVCAQHSHQGDTPARDAAQPHRWRRPGDCDRNRGAPRCRRCRGRPGCPARPGGCPVRNGVGRVPAMYTGYFRPDPAHPSQIVGVAWMDQALVTTHLIAGTREPGGTGWAPPRPGPARDTPSAGGRVRVPGHRLHRAGHGLTPGAPGWAPTRPATSSTSPGTNSLSGLAAAMVAAGVVRGMELDIHSGMVTFTTFHPAAGAAFGVTGVKLLLDMPAPSTRYLHPDERGFFLAVTLRSPTDPGAAAGGPRAPS
jgi:hypothetical protein